MIEYVIVHSVNLTPNPVARIAFQFFSKTIWDRNVLSASTRSHITSRRCDQPRLLSRSLTTYSFRKSFYLLVDLIGVVAL